MERKCKEKGGNEMLGVGRCRLDGNFIAFFNLRDDKGWGHGEYDVHCDPLRSLGTLPRNHGIKL